MSLYTFIQTKHKSTEPIIYVLQHTEQYEDTTIFGVHSTEQLASTHINELIEAEPSLFVYDEFTIREIHMDSNYTF